MRSIYLIPIMGLIGAGFYFHVITFDPLSLVVIVLLFVFDSASTNRQQTLYDALMKSYTTLSTNQREILRRVDAVRSEVVNKK